MERPPRHPLRAVSRSSLPSERRSSGSAGSDKRDVSRKDLRLRTHLRDLASSILREDGDLSEAEASRLAYEAEADASKYLSRMLKMKQSQILGNCDNDVIDAAIRSLALKHEIGLRSVISEAISKTYTSLKDTVGASQALYEASIQRAAERHEAAPHEEPVLNTGNLSSAVRLLLLLGNAPDVQTEVFATLQKDSVHVRLRLSPEDQLTAEREEVRRILAEETDFAANSDDEIEEKESTDSGDWSDLTEDDSSSDQGEGSDEEVVMALEKPTENERTRKFRVQQAMEDDFGRKKKIMFDKSHEEEEVKAKVVQGAKDTSYWARENGGRLLSSSTPFDVVSEGTFLYEIEALRESLKLLEIRENRDRSSSFLFERRNGSFFSRRNVGQLPHLSPTTYDSLLGTTAEMASSLSHLWCYVESTFESSRSRSTPPSTVELCIEAMASEIEARLHSFAQMRAKWDCQLAAAMRASTVNLSTSKLTAAHLEAWLWSEYATLSVLNNVVDEIEALGEHCSSTTVASLLDILHRALVFEVLLQSESEDLASDPHRPSISHLARCFLVASAPAWADIQSWLVGGHPAPLEGGDQSQEGRRLFFVGSESFIRSESWKKDFHGYREEFPTFLQPIARDIVTTGRAVGLLRAMGFDGFLWSIPWAEESTEWTIEKIVRASVEGAALTEDDDQNGSSVSSGYDAQDRESKVHLLDRMATFNGEQWPQDQQVDDALHETLFICSDDGFLKKTENAAKVDETGQLRDLARPLDGTSLHKALATRLSPIVSLVRRHLHDVLFASRSEGGCNLMQHLEGIQGLYLMRKGADMGSWYETLFTRLDHGNGISNANFLTSAFWESTSAHKWLDLDLVRFRWTGAAHDSLVSIHDLRSILVDYYVPWPLTYLFTSTSLQDYQSIFTLLIQLARTKAVLARTGRSRSGAASSKARQVQISRQVNLQQLSIKGTFSNAIGSVHLSTSDDAETRLFYVLRRRLTWVICIFSEYIGRDIIEGESQSLLLRFRNELISFEDLIEAHSTSLDRMIELCFLGDERDGSEGPSAAIREALLCIMELASKAADAFAVYTGEARERPIKTEERERKRRRRERKKKQKKELGRKSSRWSGLRDEDDDDEEEEEGEEGGAAEQQQQHHIKGFRKEMDDKEERPGIGDVSYAGMTTFNTTFSTFFEEDEDVGESFLDFVRRVDAKLDGALATIRRKLGLLIARASAASKHDDREALQNLAFALEG